jgi:hypothetical protein
MKVSGWWSAGAIGLVSLALAAPKGTVPRSSAEQYALHTSRDGVSIGLVALPPEQARKQFVSDVGHCCVVVEVAVYPSKDKSLDVSLNDFVLRVNGKEVGTKPASARVVASRLQKKAGSTRDITVVPEVGVGYESGGYDPVSGTQRRGGVYKQAGVGVGIGGNGLPSGSTDKDRAAMETELSEKGLPEGASSAPVAGYIYFPIERKKNSTMTLEYTVNGEKAVFKLPQ